MTNRSAEECSIAIISFHTTEKHKLKFNIENSGRNTTPAIALALQGLYEQFPVNKHPTIPSCKGIEKRELCYKHPALILVVIQ